MKPGRRSRLAFRLTLWAVVGIALLALPALLSPSSSNNIGNSFSGNTKTPPTTTTTTATITPSFNPQPMSTSQPSLDTQDFVLRLVLVLTPAAVLSSFVMVWTNRRFRESLP